MEGKKRQVERVFVIIASVLWSNIVDCLEILLKSYVCFLIQHKLKDLVKWQSDMSI